MRKTIFANDEYYHIYNRGVDKRDVFVDDFDYVRFLTSMKEFNAIEPIGSLYLKNIKDKHKKIQGVSGSTAKALAVEPLTNQLVEIIAYCLNSNLFHMILKQISENGISEFMKRLSGGYTWHFNKKYERSGVLFQGRFKSIHIDNNEYLLHLSAYININDFIYGYGNNEEWRYSSYLDYIGKRNGKLCIKEIILGQFKNKKDYQDFMDKTGEYFKDKREMEGYCLE